MCIVSSGEFHRNFGLYQDRALLEPVMITRNGRERVVLISVEEYKRLKRGDREVLKAGDLTEAELAEIAAAEVPGEYAGLDSELDS
jgi:prevent-host-death family protein